MIPPNYFTRRSILAVTSNSLVVKIERLNCMPQTPEVFYPNARLYGYDEIFENGIYKAEMKKYYNINEFKSDEIFNNLKDAPAGCYVIIERTKENI